MTALHAGAATDVGRVRGNNEDNLLVASPLFAVADGMGGHAAGEVASGIAVEVLHRRFTDDRTAAGLAEAVRAANRAVWDRARAEPRLQGMGTTLTAAALVEEDGGEILAVVNVGDSRAYRLRHGELEQLTEDHSLVEELVRAGRLSPEEAQAHPKRNVLTRVLGIEPEVEVDCFRIAPTRGDRFLLASDGLFNEVDDDAIAATLRHRADPQVAARELVEAARSAGGSDNITAVVIDLGDVVRTERADTTAKGREPPAVVRALAERARETKPPRRPTLRTGLFVGVVLLVLAAAVSAVGVFARGAYFVGIDGDEVVIYQGRPDGLLWFDPTIEVRTGLAVDDLPPSRVDVLREGKEEPSLGDARRYVEYLRVASTTTTTTTTTTVPSPAP